MTQELEDAIAAVKKERMEKEKTSLIPQDILERLYHKENLTLQEIGDIFGKTRSRISQLMKYYEIPTKRKTLKK